MGATGPAIGVDLGGTKIAGAVVGDDGTIVARSQIATDAVASGDAILPAIVKLVQELHAVAPAAVAVGVGAAGLVDVEHGIIRGAPNIAYRDVRVRDAIQSRTGLPALVDNDANVAAWGEAAHGAGRGVRDQIMVTVGTGIGGGLILDGSMYRGGYGVGAEIGHMILDASGPECGCGARGCFEMLASGNAIGRSARDRALAGEPAAAALIERAGGDAARITGEIVGEAGLGGDPFAIEVLAEAGRYLGIGLASLVNIFDPVLVVVGGGAGAGTGDLLVGPAREAMQRYTTLRALRTPVRVELATLGNDAGVIGAADLARATLAR